MVALLSFVALLLPALLACASPVPVEFTARSQTYSYAQRATYGVSVGNDVTRFVVKYANAQRWKQSTAVPISQAASLLQQVRQFSFHFVGPSLTSPIYRTFPRLVPSPVQVQRPRTVFIWLFTFQTPSVLAVTLPLSSGLFTASLSHCMCSMFLPLRIHGGSFTSGSASDPSINGAKLAAATQSIVAVVQYRLGGVRFMCCYAHSLAYLCAARLYGSRRRDKLGRQRCHQRLEGPKTRGSYDRWIRVKDHHCWPKFGRYYGQSPPCHSLRLVPLRIRDPPVRPDGDILANATNVRRLTPPFYSELRIPVHWNTTDHAELLQQTVSLQPI